MAYYGDLKGILTGLKKSTDHPSRLPIMPKDTLGSAHLDSPWALFWGLRWGIVPRWHIL